MLHPTANASTMMESFKNSFSKWQMKHINASAENIVAFRKFGHKVSLSMFQNRFGVISLNKSLIIVILFTTSAWMILMSNEWKNILRLWIISEVYYITKSQLRYSHMKQIRTKLILKKTIILEREALTISIWGHYLA